MEDQGRLWRGGLLICIGVLALLEKLTDLDLCFPVLLIGVGTWILLRPSMVAQGTQVQLHFVDTTELGAGSVFQDAEHWFLIGALKFNLRAATLPAGETHLRCCGLASDLDISLPPDVGLKISGFAPIVECQILGERYERVFAPLLYTTPGYASLPRRLALETNAFMVNLKVQN